MLRAVLDEFEAVFTRAFHARMGAKLGLASWRPEDEALLDDLLAHGCEPGRFHAVLAPPGRCGAGASQRVRGPVHRSPAASAWLDRLLARQAADGRPAQDTAQAMNQVNPLYVLRNHLAEQAIRRRSKETRARSGRCCSCCATHTPNAVVTRRMRAASGLGGRHRSQLLVLSSGLRLRKGQALI